MVGYQELMMTCLPEVLPEEYREVLIAPQTGRLKWG